MPDFRLFAVEAATVTNVGVTSDAWDLNGCGVEGCDPRLTRVRDGRRATKARDAGRRCVERVCTLKAAEVVAVEADFERALTSCAPVVGDSSLVMLRSRTEVVVRQPENMATNTIYGENL